MKLVDSNVFIHYLLEGELADEAERLLASYSDLAVTVGIVDEAEFVIIHRLAKTRLGIKRLDRLKEHIRMKGFDFAIDKLEEYTEMLREFDITLLKDYAEPRQLLETMKNYRLTPSDAIIALTCRHYGIDTILTFDEDFKRIPWLKVIP